MGHPFTFYKGRLHVNSIQANRLLEFSTSAEQEFPLSNNPDSCFDTLSAIHNNQTTTSSLALTPQHTSKSLT